MVETYIQQTSQIEQQIASRFNSPIYREVNS